MKRRITWRSLLPYIFLTVLLVALFLAVGIIQRQISEKGALQQSDIPVWPFLVYTLIVVSVGVVIGLVIHRIRMSGQTPSIQKFTSNLQALGENRFEDINPSVDFGQTNEIESLNKALLATSSQIELQISQLNKEQVMLTTVLSQMTDGVLLADHSGKVELLNKAAEGIFNISESNASGRSVVEVMRHHSLIDLWEKTLQGETSSIAFEMGVEVRAGPHQARHDRRHRDPVAGEFRPQPLGKPNSRELRRIVRQESRDAHPAADGGDVDYPAALAFHHIG